jgi:hypothetical protein
MKCITEANDTLRESYMLQQRNPPLLGSGPRLSAFAQFTEIHNTHKGTKKSPRCHHDQRKAPQAKASSASARLLLGAELRSKLQLASKET